MYSPDDSTCGGDLRLEMVMLSQAGTEDTHTGMCALGTFEDGHEEYYRCAYLYVVVCEVVHSLRS